MRPRCYVDIHIERRATPLAAALLMHVIHGVFRLQPGRYALALPDYPRIQPRLRIFAENRSDLDSLVVATKDHSAFVEHGRFGYPEDVPDSYSGPWISFRRYRIPTRKTERNEDGTVRLRRMLAADNERLPYFPLHSGSNGQTWRLYIQAVAAAAGGNADPDSYGLANASRPFAVPAIT